MNISKKKSCMPIAQIKKHNFMPKILPKVIPKIQSTVNFERKNFQIPIHITKPNFMPKVLPKVIPKVQKWNKKMTSSTISVKKKLHVRNWNKISRQKNHTEEQKYCNDQEEEELTTSKVTAPQKQILSPLAVLIDSSNGGYILRIEMKEFFIDCYNEFIADKLPSFGIDCMLGALSSLLDHVFGLKDDSCSIEAKGIAFQSVNECIIPLLSIIMDNDSSFTPNEISIVLMWLVEYREHFLPSTFPLEAALWIDKLSIEYVQRGVHIPVKLMFDNRICLMNEDEVVDNGDGTVSTSLPDDLSYIIEMQLSVARERLPSFLIPKVLTACNTELLTVVGEVMFQLEKEWKHWSVERICCKVNDALALLEYCEKCNEKIFDEKKNETCGSSDTLLKEISELSLHASKYVCEKIYLDINDKIINFVGKKNWGEGMVIDTVVATLNDYFEDIKQWIPEGYFFPKILKASMDLLFERYLNAFLRNTMISGIHNIPDVLNILQSDWQKLWDFFICKNAQYHGRAGFYKKEIIWYRLHVLEVITSLLTSNLTTPKQYQNGVLTILKQFGQDTGVAAVLHLLGLQKWRISKAEARQWHEVISTALEHAKMQCGKISPIYRIIDVRDSKFIRRMRPYQNRGSDKKLVNASIINQLHHRSEIHKTFYKYSNKVTRYDQKLIVAWKSKEKLQDCKTSR